MLYTLCLKNFLQYTQLYLEKGQGVVRRYRGPWAHRDARARGANDGALTGGIGLAIVEELHRRGASVLIADSGVSIAGADPYPALAQSVHAHVAAPVPGRIAPLAVESKHVVHTGPSIG